MRFPCAKVLGTASASIFLIAQAWHAAGQSEPVAQPIPYSHKIHLALGLKCQQCHPNPDPGAAMTIPAVAKCMECHTTIARDNPAIERLAEFSRNEQPIPWVRVYSVPSWVSWNHRRHLKAGMTCVQCHGDVAQMEVTVEATNVTKMAGCLDCHRAKHASLRCNSCHDLGPGN
jgi:Cytochrome c7 and related cytochrome c/Class III cytochrome C family